MRRLTCFTTLALVALVFSTLTAAPAPAQPRDRIYEVTVTNLTRGQTFTPVLVATHVEGIQIFTLGEPASPELAIVAEEGDVGPLTALLLSTPGVAAVANTGPPPGGFIGPGQSKTILVEGGGRFDHLSVAAMLIPTNDGFFALNGVAGPRGNQTLTLFSPAYDAGSERNDELCASIPGPFFSECGGPGGGGRPTGGEEGYVHIHAGIHGIGDLVASNRDWRNPVAKIAIRRVRGEGGGG
jgi:hypothetical protein